MPDELLYSHPLAAAYLFLFSLFFCACGRSANTKALMGQGRDNGDDSAAGITQHNGGADEGGNAS